MCCQLDGLYDRFWRKADLRHDIDVCQVAVGEIERNGKNPSTSDRNRNRVILPRLGCVQSAVLKRRME
jgi:hypothetical protein